LVSNDAKHMGGSPPAAQLRQQATLSRTRMSGDEGGGRPVVGVRFRTDGIQESQLDPASDEAHAHAESQLPTKCARTAKSSPEDPTSRAQMAESGQRCPGYCLPC